MPYGALIKKILKKNKFTYNYVAEECKKLGVKLDKSNLINIANGKKNPPSEEVSRAIAKVCNIDDRLLVLEGYIDTAPKEIITLLNNIRYTIFLYAQNGIEGLNLEDIVGTADIPENINELVKNEFFNQPIAEFIVEFLKDTEEIEMLDTGLKLSSEDNGKVTEVLLSTKEPFSFTIQDKGMEPKIPEGAKANAKFKTKHNNGDIVLVQRDNQMIARMIFYSEEEILLVPINKEYEILSYDQNDKSHILGKIEKIKIEI